MALLFGFLGLMVAVPLLAAIMVPVRRLYLGGFDSHEGAPAAVT
jgi:predicted PurR-regulated permease PerM